MHLCPAPHMPQPNTTTYESALAWLVRRNGYGDNLVNVRLTAPDGIAFFDFGNAFYTYLSMKEHAPWDAPRHRHRPPLAARGGVDGDEAPLCTKELDKLKAQFQLGFETYWSDFTLSASSQHDTLWSVIYSAVTGRQGLDDPFWMLRRWPMELIWWPARNSQRLDVTLRKDFQRCCNQNVSVWPIPPDEVRQHRPWPFPGLARISPGVDDAAQRRSSDL